MNCAEAPLIELLESELSDAQTDQLLAHLDACEDCRQRLHVMAALSAARPEKARRFTGRRIWLLAASLFVAISLPVFYFSRSSPSVESLATAGSYPHFALQTREAATTDAETRRKAYEAYAARDYAAAESLLGALPVEAQTEFYIGVSQYLQGKYAQALSRFEKASGDDRWKNPSLWYRASALLRLKRTEEAKRVLTELSITGGELSREASELLERIRERSPKE